VGEDRAQRAQHPAVGREDPGDPPAQRLRQRQQPQRLPRRRAVHDDDVELGLGDLASELEQREDLLRPRQDGELLRLERVDSSLLEHLAQVVLHLPPAGLERTLGVDLLPVQPGIDLAGPVAQRYVERVGQRVRRVGGDHEGLVALRGEVRGGSRGRRGLPDTPLPGEQKDAHRARLAIGRGLRPRRAS
jgi:hypothetical protein